MIDDLPHLITYYQLAWPTMLPGLWLPFLVGVVGLSLRAKEVLDLKLAIIANVVLATPVAVFQVIQPGNDGIHVFSILPAVLFFQVALTGRRVSFLAAFSATFWSAFIPDALGSFFRAAFVTPGASMLDPLATLGGYGIKDALLVFPVLGVIGLAAGLLLAAHNPKLRGAR